MPLTAELKKLEPKRLPLNPNYPAFRQWKRTAIEEMLTEKPFNIYVHIPFCTQRCAFCYYKTVDLKKYTATVEAKEIPLTRGHRLNSLEKMMREVLLGMKLLRLDLREFQKRHGFKLESFCGSTLKELEREGFISLFEDEIQLTSKGVLYGDYVGQTLVDCLKLMN
jgi:coproporphyrinogen III oxidase-like Fe-S oxidoreductase